MRHHRLITRTGNPHTKIILLLAGMLALAIPFAIAGPASASAGLQPEASTDPPGSGEPQQQQVVPVQLPALSSLTMIVGGSTVALSPAFDPGITEYHVTTPAAGGSLHAKTADDSRIIGYSVGGIEATLGKPADELVLEFNNPGAGMSTNVILTVKTVDGTISTDYRVNVLRLLPQQGVPAITLTATPFVYMSGVGTLIFNLSREGDTADSLDVTVNLTQEHGWLADTNHTATFAAGESKTSLSIPGGDFSSSVTQSGDLTATVAPVDGHDVTGASATVRVISRPGIAVAVTIEHPSYTVAEGAGTLDIVLVARAHSSLTSVDAFSVAVTSEARTALSDPEAPDFQAVSELPRFTSPDFQAENGSLVARKTLSVTILEDDLIEGDEYFHLHPGPTPGLTSEVAILDPEGNLCGVTCPSPYVVTIKDNDPAVTVSFGQAAYTVSEGSTRDITVTLSDDPQRTVIIPITVHEQDGASSADYSIMPQSVTFNAGETSRTISFAAAADTIDDDRERVVLCFCATLPPGVTEGPIKETMVTITQRRLTSDAERPRISVPACESNGISIFWHSGMDFQDDPAPYGWRVERRHRSEGEWITQRFDFLGAASDALQTYSEAFWDWTDTTRQLDVGYTYRVHALDENGELMGGRDWSRRAPVLCTQRDLSAFREQPGISQPACESNGISIFWHVGIDFGDQPPPHGWRVERRRLSDGAWTTTRFDFTGAESDALQTHSDEYWDWTDTTHRLDVDYTYRVHTLDSAGQLLDGRNWSRRTPAFCP